MKNTVTALLLINSMALAGDYYGGVDFNFGKGSEKWKQNNTINYDFTNTAYGLHMGYNLNQNSMIEVSFKLLTFDFKENGIKDDDGTQFGVDYLYTLNEVSKLKPYLGLGLTYSTKDIDIANLNEDTVTGIGFKLRGGAYYPLTPKLDLGIELNYNSVMWDEVEFQGNNTNLKMSSDFYGLGLNLNYKF